MGPWRTVLSAVGAATALSLLCTALPYLPGRHDSMAAPLSALALLFGKAGLLLAAAGCVWWRLPAALSLRFVVVIATGFVCAAMILGALVSSGLILGVAVMGLSVLMLRSTWMRLRVPQSQDSRMFALCLFATPLAVALTNWLLAEPLASRGRERAMRNSEPLIRLIEDYRVKHAEYPVSLIALWQDHPPGVMGVREYRYERNGEAYNLSFQLPSLVFGAEEVVMFNPRDEHLAFSHDSDRLLYDGEQLLLRQGHYRASSAGRPHWKIFEFD